jgi:hypothetical protein
MISKRSRAARPGQSEFSRRDRRAQLRAKKKSTPARTARKVAARNQLEAQKWAAELRSSTRAGKMKEKPKESSRMILNKTKITLNFNGFRSYNKREPLAPGQA